jgi:hypothetical protein
VLSSKLTGFFLLVLLGFALFSKNASGVIIYRVGAPFAEAEKDSLQDLGIDFREIDWSFSALEQGLELDSLSTGSLQPDFFDEDEDMARTVSNRGGWISVSVYGRGNTLVAQVLVDGDPSTAYVWPEAVDSPARITLDLGGQFLVKKVRFRPQAENPGRFLESFGLGVGNALRSTSCGHCVANLPLANIQKPGGVAPMERISENTDPEVTVLLEPPDGLETRFLQLNIRRVTTKAIELAEFEVYGGGFVNQASYASDIIELENLASWGPITWSGRQDPNARIEIRTRTGTDPQPDIFWEARPEQQDSIRYLQGGGSLSAKDYKASYDRLPDVFKPTDEWNRVSPDAENWSFWSSPYDFAQPGVDLASPSSRQFIQLRADFTSTSEDGGKIDYLEFKASVPPAVRGIVGEIFPPETRIGAVTHFTYFVKPTIRAGDQGFDSVEIATPAGFTSVDSLRLGGVDQAGFTWVAQEDGLGFEVQLPRKLGPADSGVVLEVVFSAPVLREVGTFFDGRVFDSTRPQEVRQQIVPGNAADEAESELLSVRTSVGESLLFAPRVFPTPFSPNGDAINDVLTISYTLLRVTAPVPVSVGIYDLSGALGALVKQVYAGEDSIGEYARSWDGTDRSNRLVAPGIYLYRLAVDLHTAREVRSGIVSVVY